MSFQGCYCLSQGRLYLGMWNRLNITLLYVS